MSLLQRPNGLGSRYPSLQAAPGQKGMMNSPGGQSSWNPQGGSGPVGQPQGSGGQIPMLPNPQLSMPKPGGALGGGGSPPQFRSFMGGSGPGSQPTLQGTPDTMRPGQMQTPAAGQMQTSHMPTPNPNSWGPSTLRSPQQGFGGALGGMQRYGQNGQAVQASHPQFNQFSGTPSGSTNLMPGGGYGGSAPSLGRPQSGLGSAPQTGSAPQQSPQSSGFGFGNNSFSTGSTPQQQAGSPGALAAWQAQRQQDPTYQANQQAYQQWAGVPGNMAGFGQMSGGGYQGGPAGRPGSNVSPSGY